MNLYQQFIAKSKYARYLNDKKRREHWPETVARYFKFMREHLEEKQDYILSKELEKELHDAVLNLEIMPSMRLLMTAGEAAKRSNICCFNCAFVPMDDQKAFDELMLILMNGTGIGFSVETFHVTKLPEVPDRLFDSNTTIEVKDSKESWAKSLRQLIALLYSGEIPKWDTSKVRAKGEPLMTFGGRASGPEPLEDLFRFVIRIFKKAVGRKLTTQECHDICCKIAEIVIVGSVRRSALISGSDLSDVRMRTAKVGEWYIINPQRALSNNSAVYREKPEIGQFMDEWKSLYDSKSGERGIFNHVAVKKQVEKNYRRKYNEMMFTNPCSEIILNPNQFCNLSTVIIKPEDRRDDLIRKVRLAAILGTFQASLTYFPYLRKSWKQITEKEALLGVSLCGILDNEITNDYNDENLPYLLDILKSAAVDTNREYAAAIGINQAAAVTCVKPEGTTSQLCNVSSGIHGQHSRYYIRTIRSDIKDPVTQFLKDAGVPNEPCNLKPNDTVIFSFPKKAPDTAILREDLSAIEHLKLWLVYQRYYCEHKPSVTISVKEHEWLDVAAWVYKNWDEMTGVSFLPYDLGTYTQAPYQEITEEEYNEMVSKMPTDFNWDDLVEYRDSVEGVQNLACSSGFCEI